MTRLEAHPAAKLFPLIQGEEFEALVADIRENGLQKPIVLLDGLVLDGRNRLRACEAAGVAPRFEEFDSSASPAKYVWSANATRRHMDAVARALVRERIVELDSAWQAEHSPEAIKRKADAARSAKAKERPRNGDGTLASGRSDDRPLVKGRLTDAERARLLAIHANPDLEDEPEPKKDHEGARRKALAAEAGVSTGTVARAQALKRAAPELAARVAPEDGKKPLPYADAKRLAAASPEERAAALAKLDAGEASNAKQALKLARAAVQAAVPERSCESDRFHLIHADFADADVEPGTVDAIICDPPYPQEFLHVFGPLGEFAKRVLKPGGHLVVMVGQSYLPEILAALTPHVRYQWTLAYLTPGGQSAQVWQRKVNTFWKPLLWFTNGPLEDGARWIGDVTKSATNDNDKRFHHWGQSESGMADVMERFTRPGDLVVDPFLGGGTTGVVAVAMNRNFIGIDVDAAAVKTSAARLAELQENA